MWQLGIYMRDIGNVNGVQLNVFDDKVLVGLTGSGNTYVDEGRCSSECAHIDFQFCITL